MVEKGSTLICLLWSGNWNNSSNSGPGALNWNNNRTNSNTNVSFRCDCNTSYSSMVETVELQGCVFPALREITQPPFFSRPEFRFENQGRSIKREICLKRIGNLFETTFTKDRLYQAYIDARRGKRKTPACFKFETRLGENLEDLHREIHTGIYRPRPFREFVVYEPKKRIIHAPHFRDTVVQHAVYMTIYPIFDKTFVNTSFACRKGFGVHKASDYTQRALRACPGDSYTLQLDIRKFFHSIDRQILRQQFTKLIKDERLIRIMMLFTQMETAMGIPIGYLLSQIYAVSYLNPLDQFIKRELKIKRYVRYMDDFILIGITRDQCLEYRKLIVRVLADNLNLELSKSSIQKVKRGLNFVGYRTWKRRRFIRKHSLYKFKREVSKENQAAVVSLLGHAKRTHSLPYLIHLIKEAEHDIEIPKSYDRIHHLQAV
jgi:RNA-directed DNA polymerase